MGDYTFNWFSAGKQQWGTFPYNSNRWTYPITFNIIFVALKTTISANTSEVGYPAWYSWSSDVTNTYAPHISSYKGYAIALGMQQWGTADGTRGNFTTNLNAPYLNFYLPYASSTNTYGTDIWTVSARVETDLSKIGLSSEGNFEIIWLAIGM